MIELKITYDDITGERFKMDWIIWLILTVMALADWAVN